MLTTVAIRGYRSLRDVVLPLTQLTVVTGANGTGKSSLYRALQLLADCGRGEIIGSLARQGGLQSAMWAGPEYLKGARRTGTVEPTVRTRPVSIEMGYASSDFGYLVDLGLPIPSDSAFGRDPEIKREAVFTGPSLRPSATLVRRTRPVVEARADSGRGFEGFSRSMPTYRSVLSEFAGKFPELGAVRDTLRGWRFYDGFRVDMLAPARQPQIGTRTTVLSNDGSDVAAAIQTIIETRSDTLDKAVAAAFDGAAVAVSVREGLFDLQVQQSGMLRPLRAAELSDGTLRFLLWAAALLSPEPPPLMVLNEPETSLHPDLIAPLATLIRAAAAKTQVVVITHANALVDHLAARPLREILAGDEDRFDDAGTAVLLELVKDWGETQIVGLDPLKAPSWHWGSR
ncbi:AAA family ATPase [Mycobacteroides salmoniphilum]|uniref:Excinuclease ABC subunit A n=1 Tax=Mycobacteroides salmoniphilum TaxID=404941 RepID=A0A4R8SBI7_9MYCO|nr:AAA family ATPase [Mycobacteroides salmoniphilum]TDZ91894.1 excinuclease ABC subunit A [Mycobacteroides salmoniphilum]TEA07125.1 excinuclease ABC subunit A [Mycobacteroides salmoniphilum]